MQVWSGLISVDRYPKKSYIIRYIDVKLLVEALLVGLTSLTYRGLSAKEARLLLPDTKPELDKFPFFARWPTFFDFTISFPFFSSQSFHAELHQYKHHIELFNQLTQKLIAVYQQDDTTRVKKMTETINQRYNNLNTR